MLKSDESMEVVPLDDNEWTEDREKYCKRLANSRGAFVWLHSKSANYYYFWNKFWTVVVAVISGIFASIITIADVIPDWSDGWKVAVAFASVTIAACVLGTILQAMNLDTKSVHHSKASGKSTTLFMRISKEMQKPAHRRVFAVKFIHSIMEEDSVLRNQSSHIPGHVLRKYYDKFGGSAIEYDILFGDDELLKIEEEINEIDKDCSDNDKEIKIVDRVILNMSHGIHIKSQISLPPLRRSPGAMSNNLEEHIKNHDKKSKYRKPPDLSQQQLFDLEKYLNDSF